jgi:predicted nuclease of predicted toxin-antitoxin system
MQLKRFENVNLHWSQGDEISGRQCVITLSGWGLRGAGHDAFYIRDYGLQVTEDKKVFSLAETENRILISSETDFGTILALGRKNIPSIILFRRGSDRRPEKQVTLLLSNLPLIQDALEQGAVVVFEQMRLRIHTLPIQE